MRGYGMYPIVVLTEVQYLCVKIGSKLHIQIEKKRIPTVTLTMF